MKAIGLMSGTSLDGVDVALLETDGNIVISTGPTGYRPYQAHERALLRQALADAKNLTDRDARPGVLDEAEMMVTQAHAEAVTTFCHANGVLPKNIDLVGFHGQTVLHRPEQRLTVQIGDGAALARALSIKVVSDFRAADVAAGGQGAPLVPVYHQALARAQALEMPVVVVNIGGVSNITYIDTDDLIACDTGPGNALIDDFMLRATGQGFDENGAAAAKGQPDRHWLEQALAHPFFALAPPKSLDRNAFAAIELPSMPVADGAATLTAFTVEAIAKILPMLPKAPRNWVIAGGGAHNTTIMQGLRLRLAPATVSPARDLGWSSDAIEAQAFAYLAVRAFKNMPLTFPATTGVEKPIGGGVVSAFS